VAVIDSGMGGVAVLRELVALAPGGDFVYLADHAGHPYGNRPPAEIAARVSRLADVALDLGATGIVVACNTATAVAVDALRARLPMVPVVGIEPPIKPAAAVTRTGVIGVLATAPTTASARVARLVESHAEGVRVVLTACPGLADVVERGWLDTPTTLALIRRYVGPLLAAGADTLAIGCTHYAFLLPAIASIAGSDVTIVDGSAAVARRAAQVVPGLAAGAGTVRWLSTEVDAADGLGRAWGSPVRVDALAW
jgi:glutamate racemase